jgi:hypothetical protein
LREELEEAFRRYWSTGAVGEDWHGWADCLTEDVEYVEHQLGNLRGREAVRSWIVPLMQQYTEIYTPYRWHQIDVEAGRIVVYMINRRDRPGGGAAIDFPGISILDYAGNGLFGRQEDFWAFQAGKDAYLSYEKLAAKHDPGHRARATRRDWGDGPPWCHGEAVGPTARKP